MRCKRRCYRCSLYNGAIAMHGAAADDCTIRACPVTLRNVTGKCELNRFRTDSPTFAEVKKTNCQEHITVECRSR